MMRSIIAAPLLTLTLLPLAPASTAVAAPAAEESKKPETPDEQAALRASIDEVSQRRFLHGFRLGYLYVNGIHDPINPEHPELGSLSSKYGMRSPHQFLIGYEGMWRMIGHDWLNVLLLGNVTVAGLEQSKVFPSGNLLIGFEVSELLQLGVGVNANPTLDKPAHMIVGAGLTPRVGDFYTPVHAFFIPDVDGQHRMGVTVGVNW
jgi:hypothetical protein